MDKVIKVSNCQECDFANYDSEFGFRSCNISQDVTKSLDYWEQLPSDKVHPLCELNKYRVIVELENKGDE